MPTLEKLYEVTDLRSIWANEATDFTPWLMQEENMALLSEAVGFDIVAEKSESSVGEFRADIVANEANSERKIIIENQLEDTNHDHLGKLITYASGKSASVIIWIVKRAREEHKSAIEWLNRHTDEGIGFFLCEIKLYRIGNSAPAVKFEVVERPNDWQKYFKMDENIKPRHRLRFEYWSAFNDYARNNALFMQNFQLKKPNHDHWMPLAIGEASCRLEITIVQKRNELGVELYIAEDKGLFRLLEQKSAEISAELGFNLEWRELPNKKASRIIVIKEVSGFSAADNLPGQFEWIIAKTVKMKTVFKKYLRAISQ